MRDETSRQKVLGIGAKLLLAFGLSTLLTVVAAAVAVLAFDTTATAIGVITARGLPIMGEALELAQQAKGFAAGAPQLANAVSQEDRSRQVDILRQDIARTREMIASISQSDPVAVDGIRHSGEMLEILDAVDRAVQQRLALTTRRTETATAVQKAHDAFLKIAIPLVDTTYFDLVITGERLAAAGDAAGIGRLLDEDVARLRAVTDLQAQGNLLAGLLTNAASVPDVAHLQPLSERYVAAVLTLEDLLAEMAGEPEVDKLLAATRTLADHGRVAPTVFEIRRQELETAQTVSVLIRDATELAQVIVSNVDAVAVGAQQEIAVMAEKTEASIEKGRVIIATLTAAAVVVAILIGWRLVWRQVVAPLTVLAQAIRRLAAGDHAIDLPAAGGDEVGAIAAALTVFRDNALEMESLRRESAEAEQRQQAEHAQHLNALADGLEGAVKTLVADIESQAATIAMTAQKMGTRIDHATSRSLDVAEAAERTTGQVAALSGSTEQLSTAIGGIGDQVSESSNIAAQAVAQADTTRQLMRSLTEAANEIGEVVALISGIAAQTNLLALNATIEAARAGEAGKGFAVVANEVKTLANQTAQATGRIGAQVNAIQSVTGEAVGAIGAIGGTIDRLHSIANTIRDGVDLQKDATRAITDSMLQVRADAETVHGNVVDSTRSSAASFGSAIQVMWVAHDLGGPARTLKQQVDDFLTSVRV